MTTKGESQPEPSAWDRIKGVGEGVVKVGFGTLTVIGSGILEIESVGSLTGPMAVTATFGANSVGGGLSDIWNATFGDFEKVGEVNPLKDEIQDVTEWAIDIVSDDQTTIDNWTNGAGLVVDGADMIVSANGVKDGVVKMATKYDKYVSFATNVIGNTMTKNPKPTILAKTFAGADVINNLNSMYNNAKDNIEEFFGNLFH